jgi:hypothetical protein
MLAIMCCSINQCMDMFDVVIVLRLEQRVGD